MLSGSSWGREAIKSPCVLSCAPAPEGELPGSLPVSPLAQRSVSAPVPTRQCPAGSGEACAEVACAACTCRRWWAEGSVPAVRVTEMWAAWWEEGREGKRVLESGSRIHWTGHSLGFLPPLQPLQQTWQLNSRAWSSCRLQGWRGSGRASPAGSSWASWGRAGFPASPPSSADGPACASTAGHGRLPGSLGLFTSLSCPSPCGRAGPARYGKPLSLFGGHLSSHHSTACSLASLEGLR